MDKMGECDVSGNRGTPATPRDGSDVEIIGMVKSTTRWLSSLAKDGKYPHTGVIRDGKPFSYQEWDDLLQAQFENYFWVPLDPADDAKHHQSTSMVHRRGMYKDTVGATSEWCDYQLRPNFAMAMCVAPELFTKENAQVALKQAEELLLGGFGLRTLDPGDMQYRPSYFNGQSTTDFSTSRGFNYHQGVEWTWVSGSRLSARTRKRLRRACAALIGPRSIETARSVPCKVLRKALLTGSAAASVAAGARVLHARKDHFRG